MRLIDLINAINETLKVWRRICIGCIRFVTWAMIRM